MASVGTPVGKSRLVNAFSPNKSVQNTPLYSKRNSVANSTTATPNGKLRRARKGKLTTFNDTIHGSVNLSGLCLRIVDTKEFQRLRNLKQLGTCDFVYDGATHTRFEHSIGVSHLAEKMARHLQQAQPSLEISDVDVLCVKIAGLCHDLGHGPFSHVFDGVFMKRMHPKGYHRHEDASVAMFQRILSANNINIADYELTPGDQKFIEEIIQGTAEKDRTGRTAEKHYLYDIVNNTRSGLDVDKLDYFQRDMKYTNAAVGTCLERFIELSKVLRAEPIGYVRSSDDGIDTQSTNGRANLSTIHEKKPVFGLFGSAVESAFPFMICYPEKLVREAVEVFALRFRLHQVAYTHKSVKKVEFMITDALELANDYISIPGSVTEKHPDGRYKMSDCMEDAEALSNLDDRVLYLIESSQDERMKPAQDIISRIRRRELYACLGKTSYKRGGTIDKMSESEITNALVKCSQQLAEEAVREMHERAAAEEGQQQQQTEVEESFKIRRLDDRMPFSSGTASASASSTATNELQRRMDAMTNNINASSEMSRYSENICSQDSFSDFVLDSSNNNNNNNTNNNKRTRNNKLKRTGSMNSTCSMGGCGGVDPSIDRTATLSAADIIVEKMNIHYGQKGRNPVDNMRFFPKNCDDKHIARRLDESHYETALPRVFEDCAIRVFCRHPGKCLFIAQAAFNKWCSDVKLHTPFLPSTQDNHDDVGSDTEEEGDDEEAEENEEQQEETGGNDLSYEKDFREEEE